MLSTKIARPLKSEALVMLKYKTLFFLKVCVSVRVCMSLFFLHCGAQF